MKWHYHLAKRDFLLNKNIMETKSNFFPSTIIISTLNAASLTYNMTTTSRMLYDLTCLGCLAWI